MLLKITNLLKRFKGVLKLPIPWHDQIKQKKVAKTTPLTIPEPITTSTSKFEFSKLLIILYSTFAIGWVNWYFILVTLQIETGEMGTVVVSILEKIVYVVLVYFLYQGWMKSSRNKYGIDTDGIPYAIKGEYERIFEEAPPSECEKSEGEMKSSDELSE